MYPLPCAAQARAQHHALLCAQRQSGQGHACLRPSHPATAVLAVEARGRGRGRRAGAGHCVPVSAGSGRPCRQGHPWPRPHALLGSVMVSQPWWHPASATPALVLLVSTCHVPAVMNIKTGHRLYLSVLISLLQTGPDHHSNGCSFGTQGSRYETCALEMISCKHSSLPAYNETMILLPL